MGRSGRSGNTPWRDRSENRPVPPVGFSGARNVSERQPISTVITQFATIAELTTWPLWLRVALASASALALALILGAPLIRVLGRHLRERNVSDSPTLEQLHRHKHLTPTMGGLFVVAAITTSMLAWCNWRHTSLVAIPILIAGLTVVGAGDDLIKLRTGRGLRAIWKLSLQTIVATIAVCLVYFTSHDSNSSAQLLVPGVGAFSLGPWLIPLGVLVVVGSSNAVNLTDGLDGLASGCLVFAVAAIGLLAALASRPNLAGQFGVLYVPAAGEIAVVSGAALGAVLGFLWFNRHPARVFLGDTGSLPLGGLLGLLGVMIRQELLLVIIGGVFVAEALSVMAQVGYFKLRRQRILLCAPLHHHFQFLGWKESQIVTRFWIAAALCAVLGLSCLSLCRASKSTDRFFLLTTIQQGSSNP